MPSRSLPILAACLAMAVLYLRGWYQLQVTLPNLLRTRQFAAFLAGIVLLWAALGSPLAALDHRYLTAHMVQHLLLMTLATPLILLGEPAIALLRGFPLDLRRPFRRRPALLRIGRAVTHPVFCWLASTAVVIAWHVPGNFEAAMRSPEWHAVEQASFFFAGILFWWPVIQPWPAVAKWGPWSIPVYLFLATLPCDALSAFLTFCNHAVYPHYIRAPGDFDLSVLKDQACAGALMWVWVTFAYLFPAIAFLLRLLSPERRYVKPQAA